MRADRQQRDLARGQRRRGGRRWRGRAGGTQRHARHRMQRGAEPGETRLGEGRADQRHADRPAIGAEAGRHGQGREVADIDEIGVGAEPAVRRHRLRRQVGQRRRAGRGRQQQDVGPGEQQPGQAARLGGGVEIVPGIDGALVQPGFQDAARDRVDRLRLRRQQVAQRRGALRHPGAVIEAAGDRQEGRDIDAGDGAAQRLGPRQGGVVQRGIVRAVEDQLLRQRCGQPPGRLRHRRGAPAGRGRAGIAVGRGGARHHLQHRAGIGDRQREDRDDVERAAGRHHALGRHQAEARLEADDVVQHRRHAAGPGGIRPQREGGDARSHRGRGAGGGAAGDAVRHHRVARRAMGAARAVQARWRTGRG